jgi:IS1 family transposase/ribosomal protein L37AE/L43A
VNTPRSPIQTLACPNPDCQTHAKPGLENLKIIKTYGKDQIRYLKCRTCKTEFSERKNTPLWNAKIPEERIAQIGEAFAEKGSYQAAARQTKTARNTVKRYANKLGVHAQAFHDARAVNLAVTALEFDERHGFAISKEHQFWEGNALDPQSKFMLEISFGRRDESMIHDLMIATKNRLAPSKDLLVMTDGLASYKSLFPEVFGRAYPGKWRAGRDPRGRRPNPIYRVPHGVAHVQVVKTRQGKRIVQVETRLAHGSKKTFKQGLERLGYKQGNTSAIERFNATARGMNAFQVRRSLVFAREPVSRVRAGWWSAVVYNFCRVNRALRVRLEVPVGRRKFLERSPAMAIRISDRVWNVLEVLRTPVYGSRAVW